MWNGRLSPLPRSQPRVLTWPAGSASRQQCSSSSRLPDKIGTCQASAVAQDERQRQQRAMPSGKIVPRSSWSAGTGSRRPRSRRACGQSCTCGTSLPRLRLRRPRPAPITPARPSIGWAAERSLSPGRHPLGHQSLANFVPNGERRGTHVPRRAAAPQMWS
jgi:hypothetical protein